MDSEGTTVRYFPWQRTVRLFLLGAVLTVITNFPSAFTHTSVNTAVKELHLYLNNSFEDRGWILDGDEHSMVHGVVNSCWFAGQIVGSLFSPIITDRYGRKPAYLLATAMMTIACVIQVVATLFPYPELLIIGRVLASMFSPMSDAVAILYLQEVSPTHLRGVLSSLFTTGYAVMALLGAVLGMKAVLGHSLTLLLSVPVIPGVLSLLFLLWLPETPKFLMISKKDSEAARRSLAFYQGEAQAQDDLILEEYRCEGRETDDKQEAKMSDLFRVPYLRQAMMLTVMCCTLCLPFYPIMQSSTHFLQEIDVPRSYAELSSSLLMVTMVISCIFAAGLLGEFSRRGLILVLGLLCTLSVVVFAVFASIAKENPVFKYVAVGGFFGYIVFYGLGTGPISYFIGTELVPLQYRSTMFCVCYSLSNVTIVLTNTAAIWLFKRGGAIWFIPLFIIPSTISLLYLYMYMPETKGKEIHTIVAALKAGRRKINPKIGFVDQRDEEEKA